MPGVYFIVVSDKEARGVRHVKIEKADYGMRVAMLMPTNSKEKEHAWERCVFDNLKQAIAAAEKPYKMMHPVGGSKYYTNLQRHRSHAQWLDHLSGYLLWEGKCD